jgi:hypothetical protein
MVSPCGYALPTFCCCERDGGSFDRLGNTGFEEDKRHIECRTGCYVSVLWVIDDDTGFNAIGSQPSLAAGAVLIVVGAYRRGTVKQGGGGGLAPPKPSALSRV